MSEYIDLTFDHIRYLSQEIGGRGSCTPDERRAAEYVADRLRQLGAQKVRVEKFNGVASTYRPFLLVFALALLGTLLSLFSGGRLTMGLGAIMNGLGLWGMLRETDFSNNWMRLILPKAESQNVVAVLPSTQATKQRIVLCAHLDTHRTPIFYSTPTWRSLFGLLVSSAFASMALSLMAFALGGILDWGWLRWVGLLSAPVQLFVLVMLAQADFTPFSPGANDNASGVGLVLSLVSQFVRRSLKNCEVWVTFTGCEEVGSYGMLAFLDAHADELGSDAVYITLDEVGLGKASYLANDGLIIKRRTHPRALELARAARNGLPNLGVIERPGLAYTDALPVTKRGLVSITVSSLPEASGDGVSHWHQMSDTIEHVGEQALVEARAFVEYILLQIDQEA